MKKLVLSLVVLTSMATATKPLVAATDVPIMSTMADILTLLTLNNHMATADLESTPYATIIAERVEAILLMAPEDQREVLKPMVTNQVWMDMFGLPADPGRRVPGDTSVCLPAGAVQERVKSRRRKLTPKHQEKNNRYTATDNRFQHAAARG